MTESPRPAAVNSRPPGSILFLCVHNSARSQIAEGLARQRAPSGVRVWSAGIERSRVHPAAVEVMREIGISLDEQASKRLEDVPWREADTVVTLCGEADEVCPALAPSVRRMHWPLPDPARVEGTDQLAAFREVRDEIRWRVASLWPPG
jgi:arsenate reductase